MYIALNPLKNKYIFVVSIVAVCNKKVTIYKLVAVLKKIKYF